MEVHGDLARLVTPAHVAKGGSELPAPGSDVSATVQKYLGKGVWLLDINGKAVEARSHLSLYPGRVISGRIERRGGVLMVVARGAAASSLGPLLQEAGLSESSFSRSLFSLLLSSMVSPRPHLLKQLSQLLEDSRNSRRPRLSAEASARGFDRLPSELSELFAGLLGAGGSKERADSDGRGRKRDPEKRSRLPGEQLRSAALRTTDSGNHPLQLYNHLAPRGSGWISLPVAFTASSTDAAEEERFDGFLHLAVTGDTGRWSLDIASAGIRYRIVRSSSGLLYLDVSADEKEKGAPVVRRIRRDLQRVLEEAGYRASLADAPYDGIEFVDHTDLQAGVDLLQ